MNSPASEALSDKRQSRESESYFTTASTPQFWFHQKQNQMIMQAHIVGRA
jgi:hypothetical protein